MQGMHPADDYAVQTFLTELLSKNTVPYPDQLKFAVRGHVQDLLKVSENHVSIRTVVQSSESSDPELTVPTPRMECICTESASYMIPWCLLSRWTLFRGIVTEKRSERSLASLCTLIPVTVADVPVTLC